MERVEIVEGGDVRLTLRRAWFHDGRPLKAEDVRASLERFASSSTAGAVLAAQGGAFVRVAGEREVRLGAEDYADEILATLETNLGKFMSAVQRGREQLQRRSSEAFEAE